MTRLIDVIIEQTNKDLDAVKKMKKQMDDIMATQTSDDTKSICAQYRNAVQTRQKLFKRTQHK